MILRTSLAVLIMMLSGIYVPAQTLLFKSSFEPGTSLQSLSGAGNMSAGESGEQLINGLDSSTLFNWSTMWNLFSPGLSGIHLIPGDGLMGRPYSQAFQSRIDTTTAHSGSQSLFLNVTGFTSPNCISNCGQAAMASSGGSVLPIRELYVRFWQKFPASMFTQAQGQASWWRSFFEFKSTNNLRYTTYIYRNVGANGGNLYWHAQVDDLTDFHDTGANLNIFFSNTNFTPVPNNQWFMVEMYFKLSSGSDGRFFWSMTDPSGVNHVLFDVKAANFNGVTLTGNRGSETITGNLNEIMWNNVYGSMWPASQWMDDFEVWSSAPCGVANLPCGPGSTSTGQVQPPRNLVATPR